jgi:hypothetical protein
MERHVRFDSEVTEIARIVFPAEDIRSAKKTVRDAAQHAEKIGGLVIERQQGQGESTPRLYVYQSDFREWAAAKWPELRSHFQIAIVGTINCVLPIPRFAGHAVSIPPDPDELVRQFVAVSDALLTANEELAECTKRLDQMVQDAAKRQEKDDLTTQRKKEAGKVGGRGNRNYGTRD